MGIDIHTEACSARQSSLEAVAGSAPNWRSGSNPLPAMWPSLGELPDRDLHALSGDLTDPWGVDDAGCGECITARIGVSPLLPVWIR
jgi:hypothetical protein